MLLRKYDTSEVITIYADKLTFLPSFKLLSVPGNRTHFTGWISSTLKRSARKTTRFCFIDLRNKDDTIWSEGAYSNAAEDSVFWDVTLSHWGRGPRGPQHNKV